MGVVTDQIIKKQSTNTITGAISYFNDKVVDAIYNKATYYTGKIPHFTGDYAIKGGVVKKNPVAIEASQFDTNTRPYITVGSIVDAQELWAEMYRVTQAMNKVRFFKARWIHYINSAIHTQLGEFSGYGVMNIYNPVTTGSIVSHGDSEYRLRDNAYEVKLYPYSLLCTDNIISAHDVNATIDNCYFTWENHCYNNNQILYTLYTCHHNCHSNCHNTRSRR